MNPDSSYKNIYEASSSYFFSSNAITNDFAKAYYLGEFIDEMKKDGVSEKLSSMNRFGAGFGSKLSYTKRNTTIFGLPNSQYTVSLSSQYHINSNFSRDAFQLYFRGNKQYAGKAADLGNFFYRQIGWQQLNFTFGHAFNRNENKFGYSAGINLINGFKLYSIEAPRAKLFTEESGMYIDLDTEVEIYQSDSAEKKLTSMNGLGAAIDLSAYWTDKKNNILRLQIQNLGFITWNSNTAYVHADTTFRFEGVDVSEFFEFGDSIKETISLDSSLVEPYLSKRQKKSHNTPIPASIKVSYKYVLTPGKTDVEAAISYLAWADARMLETISVSHLLRNRHTFSLKLSHGGYTGFQAGFGYKLRFLEHWMITIQSDYLSSMMNPSKGTASGAFVSLAGYF